MIRALIIDDEEPARDKLKRWLEQQADVEVVGEYADGLSAARGLAAVAADVAFLDIQMPGLTGLEVAAQLESDEAPLLVFVTAYDAHAVAAFDLNAVDYLLKPYDEERFCRGLNRVRERLASVDGSAAAVQVARAQAGARDRLLVPDGQGLRLIDSAAIHWLEAADNYVQVHAANRCYLLRRSLRDLLLQLGEDRFVRIHKSTAVNLAQIDTIAPLFKGDHELRLRSGQRCRVSRRYVTALFDRLGH